MSLLEEMPLRLLIVVVVLSSTLPYLYDALMGYSEESTLSYLDEELNRFITAAQTVYRLGVGTTRSVTLTIRSPGAESVESVIIGGDLKEERRYLPVIRIRLGGGAERLLVTEPNIPMSSSTGNFHPLVLGEGVWKIKMEHIVLEDEEGRSLHLVDLTVASQQESQ